MKVFQELGPPKAVQEIRYFRKGPEPLWCEITGWSLEQGGCPSPVLCQRIGDSGEGHAFLIYGGTGGLRLRPSGSPGSWSLKDSRQWGEAYLVYGDESDIHYAA